MLNNNLKNILKLFNNETILISNNLLDHKDFGIYSDYLYGQGWNINKSINYKEIFELFTHSKSNLNIINIFLEKYKKFNSIHVRRGDYNTKIFEIGNTKYKNSTLTDTFGKNSFY